MQTNPFLFKSQSKVLFLKHCLGLIIWRISGLKKNQLLVLNYHGTQQKFLKNFESQINFLQKHFEFITPNEFFKIISSREKSSTRKILITFDDGIRNNLHALNVLEKLHIKALVFVIPQFINTETEKQKDYFIKYIRPIHNRYIDSAPEDFQTFSWPEIEAIGKTHNIGSHSYTHQMTTEMQLLLLKKEIVTSQKEIELHTAAHVNSFCSINNTLLSVGVTAVSLILENYDFHFTTFPGNNIPSDPHLIKRINIESHWPIGAIKWAISPLDWMRYSVKINKFNNLRNQILHNESSF